MKVGVFHKFIAGKFLEKGDFLTNTIKRSTARKVLYINHVPLKIHYDFLNEMEKYKLIEIQDNNTILILEKNKKEDDWF